MKPQIDVRKAVSIANDYVSELFPASENKRLEEVELQDDGFWHVVISFAGDGEERVNLLNLQSRLNPRRLYKDVVIDSANGTPRALRMVAA